MITLLEKFLEKHSRWLLIFLFVVVIVPFIFTIGAVPSFGHGRNRAPRKFFGLNLDSPKDLESAQRTTAMSLWLQKQSDLPFEQALFGRQTWLAIANDLQIPDPTERQLGRYIRTLPAFLDGDQFSESAYGEFRRQADPTLAARTLAEDWKINLLAANLAAAPLTLEAETILQWKLLNSRWVIDVARLPFKNFHVEVEVDDGKLVRFFREHQKYFLSPETVTIAVVHFPGGAVAEPTEAELERFFEENKKLWPAAGENPDFFRSHRREILDRHRTVLQRQEALKRASDFAYGLYEGGITADRMDEIGQRAERMGGQIETIDPFSRKNIPNYRGLPSEILAGAFSLSSDNFFSDPIPLEDGAAILLFRGRRPEEAPDFEAVRSAVTEQFRAHETLRLFMERAKDLRRSLLSHGDDFPAAARGCGFSVRTEPMFSLKDRPETVPAEYVSAFIGLKSGAISQFLVDRPDLILIHVQERRLPEDQPAGQDLKDLHRQLSTAANHRMLQELLNRLIGSELEKIESP